MSLTLDSMNTTNIGGPGGPGYKAGENAKGAIQVGHTDAQNNSDNRVLVVENISRELYLAKLKGQETVVKDEYNATENDLKLKRALLIAAAVICALIFVAGITTLAMCCFPSALFLPLLLVGCLGTGPSGGHAFILSGDIQENKKNLADRQRKIQSCVDLLNNPKHSFLKFIERNMESDMQPSDLTADQLMRLQNDYEEVRRQAIIEHFAAEGKKILES